MNHLKNVLKQHQQNHKLKTNYLVLFVEILLFSLETEKIEKSMKDKTEEGEQDKSSTQKTDGQNSKNTQDEEVSDQVPEVALALTEAGVDGGGTGVLPDGCTSAETLRKKTPKSKPRKRQKESEQRRS